MKILQGVSSFQEIDGGVPRAVGGMIDLICHYPNYEIHLQYGEDGKHPFFPIDPLIKRLPIPHLARGSLHRVMPTGFYKATLKAHKANQYNLAHFHGVWLRTTHEFNMACHETSLPLIISPHGMFEKWSMAHNRWKKQIAWRLFQRRDCLRARAFHVTSLMEARAVRDLGLKQPIALIANGVPEISDKPLAPESLEKPKGRRIALYFSRLSGKKNIPTLLKAWAKLRPENWELIIVGNDSEDITPSLIALTEKLKITDDVSFPGPMFGADKDTIFRRADLFVLPTFSENFGIVVTEALQYGVPVITTTGTPWEDLPRRGCGWWVEPTTEGFSSALAEACAMQSDQLKSMGTKGVSWVRESFLWKPLAKQQALFYEWLLGRGDKPECVLSD